MSQRPWMPLPTFFPADGQTVWVRSVYEGTAPFEATFTLSTLTFRPSFGGPDMPWYLLSRWRV